MSDANRDERVSRRAYELWEQEGGEHGRHDDHWHRAAAEHDAGQVGDRRDEGAESAVAAPDGTTLTVSTDDLESAPAKPVAKRAAPKTKAERAAPAPAKATAKPRKPKAK